MIPVYIFSLSGNHKENVFNSERYFSCSIGANLDFEEIQLNSLPKIFTKKRPTNTIYTAAHKFTLFCFKSPSPHTHHSCPRCCPCFPHPLPYPAPSCSSRPKPQQRKPPPGLQHSRQISPLQSQPSQPQHHATSANSPHTHPQQGDNQTPDHSPPA